MVNDIFFNTANAHRLRSCGVLLFLKDSSWLRGVETAGIFTDISRIITPHVNYTK